MTTNTLTPRSREGKRKENYEAIQKTKSEGRSYERILIITIVRIKTLKVHKWINRKTIAIVSHFNDLRKFNVIICIQGK